MQESTSARTGNERERQMGSTDNDKHADIRQPSINTEMKMERAMVTAQKIYAQDPSEDFTKDAVDTATMENAPAEDANLLGKHLYDLVQKARDELET